MVNNPSWGSPGGDRINIERLRGAAEEVSAALLRSVPVFQAEGPPLVIVADRGGDEVAASR